MKRLFYILSLLTILTTTVVAQSDTLVVRDTTAIDVDERPKVKRNTFRTIFQGNPGKAALYSLLIPAGGQIYNKKWWKVPLALGIEGGTMGWAIYTRSRFKLFDGIWQDLNEGIVDNPFGFTQPTDVVPVRSQARQRMEYSWVFILIGKLVTVFDAYVDRHLIEFDISEDLTYGGSSFPALKIGIPLHRPTKQKAYIIP